MQRRTLLQRAFAALLLPAVAAKAAPAAPGAKGALPVIEVYKSESCGCCHLWVDHLRANGFTVKATDVPDPSAYRKKHGVPEALGSCHTGVVAGYALEGHVPAAEVKRLLAERPKARGLAVPGMPMGSPGMEGSRKDSYDVLLIEADGRSRVYRHYGA
ncbi:DUF411 domain-containing protein [Noviherbaspirillum sp.]|uniref:DUF411 domain-containing protein n=1 Tax=Noviherbaspirillum sp. TaxID=1926288 RepID=UPI002D2DB340|nr:DUF411 domain-containing protein [Noviherbaspirillum sp.]HZW20653.1 DUF411 domain-containing protein [Noviherbaspirillum sp.]